MIGFFIAGYRRLTTGQLFVIDPQEQTAKRFLQLLENKKPPTGDLPHKTVLHQGVIKATLN